MASDAPPLRERVDDRETSAGGATVCAPSRNDGGAIVPVAYLKAKRVITHRDLQHDRFDRMHDRVRHQFRHNQTGVLSYLTIEAVRIQKRANVVPCAERRYPVLRERHL